MKSGEPFYWGVSSSAAQSEGAADADGKGPSIWDEFSLRKGKIKDRTSIATGAGFYHHFREDLKLISELSIPNFRFSISWPRILPGGTGFLNTKGLDFYDRLTDSMLEANITPWVTLYHWDLPAALQNRGGWNNREVVSWFSDYADIVTRKLGDRVLNWMVLNEPMAFTGAGYFLGVHAPGKKGIDSFLSAAHHAALATSMGAQVIRKNVSKAYVGSTYSQSAIHPATFSEKDTAAAARVNDLINLFFLLPATGHGYPLQRLKFLRRIEKFIKPGDESQLNAHLDFIGVQTYTREVVSFSHFVPFVKARMISAEKRGVKSTQMGWEVYPPSIYEVLKQLHSVNGIPEMIITENGAAFEDPVPEHNRINDIERISYLQSHIDMVKKAVDEGVNVKGYFVWSVTDNFEWAEGYRPRFGLIHVDYKNELKRTIKNSGYWYRDLIQNSKR